ncbi:MAG: nicotinate (nicotinamide) nucleotide adenylyltransferase [Sedimentisphaerales bacterium]|nr:nicotinate (nicotinamide) nucleotide adenylyltransferase [Sedimentisphaerales bacterium]
MKLILFGGTFDPVHRGHIQVARYSFEKICADKLIFVPAKRSPHKGNFPVASGEHRLNMLSIAAESIDNFVVSDLELERPDPSYTIDTVTAFKEKYGKETQIFWLIGADTVEDLPKWHRIKDLIDACNLSVMYRAGFKKPDFTVFREHLGENRIDKLGKHVISTPLVDISSTEIREKLSRGVDVCDLLESDVIRYIRQNNLYGS